MSIQHLLLAWPDQLENLDREPEGKRICNSVTDAAKLIRIGQKFLEVEAWLLQQITRETDQLCCYALLAFLYFSQGKYSHFQSIVNKLREIDPNDELTRWLQILGWLKALDGEALEAASPSIWRDEFGSWLLMSARCRYLVASRQFSAFEEYLRVVPDEVRSSPEVLICRADHMFGIGDPHNALQLLAPELHRVTKHRQFVLRVIELAIDARNAQILLPAVRLALKVFGEDPLFLTSVGAIKLYQRQPGLALRAILMKRLFGSTPNTKLLPDDASNLLSAYEFNGVSNWLEYLPEDVLNSELANQPLQGNLCMQFASIESPRYQSHVTQYLQRLEGLADAKLYRDAGLGAPSMSWHDKRDSLRIGWVTADLAPHPVSRFLLQFFSASTTKLAHTHCIVNTFNHQQESCAFWFDSFSDIFVEDVANFDGVDRVAAIRDLQLDIAIDLSGWTSNHFLAGFSARLAPVQINYLGYFASSGIQSMDYWLGDKNLFPDPMVEWHTETIWRLNRPFIAWQPTAPLPESEVDVTDFASNGPIKFGSFNHNRKLSDSTLRLWGCILSSIPGSRLVLKANAQDDPHTQVLLRRRLIKQGIDPERIDWLPLTKSSIDHLLQYQHLDIALDPIPNGGCTTTCEALWMGVPVITLAGRGYVSRMSTAVLRGVGLHDWVASSLDDYVSIARQKADDIQSLRTSREQWRHKLVNSPVGDASGLMQALEVSFLEMVKAVK